jgi:hypothetical protein
MIMKLHLYIIVSIIVKHVINIIYQFKFNFMEMFNKKVLRGRIGNLKKHSALNALEQVESYAIRKMSEYGIEYSYDVMAEEMPFFNTFAYTSYATSFLFQPLNSKLRNEMMTDAWYDNESKVLDWSSYLISNVLDGTSNKYQDREMEYEKYPPRDYLMVLPGSNKVKTNICLNRMKFIHKKCAGNLYVKPHPITTHKIIGELKDLFGEDSVLPRNVDMYYYMQKARGVYTTHISESALYASLLGKKIEPFDVWNDIRYGSFYTINNYLFTNQHNIKNYVNKTFSSYKSGIINPNVDKNWKLKIDKYLAYMMKKRSIYQNWFIDSRVPKNKK